MAEKVRVFSTPTCPYCKQAKEFLATQGVAFEDHDVTADQEALKEMRAISHGARTVPVIVIEDLVFVGYDEADITKALREKGYLTS